METRQGPNESIIQLELRLKDTCKYYELEKLGTKDMTTEDVLILFRLITYRTHRTNTKYMKGYT